MKKGFGIFLFICLIAPFIFCYTWLTIGKQSVRKEIKQKIIRGIDKESLTLLSFTRMEADAVLHWENAGEFEYKGEMYDVIETEISGDTLHFRCFWDHKETTLNAQIKDLLTKALGKHPQNKENQKRLISFFQTIYLQDHFNWKPETLSSNTKIHPEIRSFYPDIYTAPPVPPPRNC